MIDKIMVSYILEQDMKEKLKECVDMCSKNDLDFRIDNSECLLSIYPECKCKYMMDTYVLNPQGGIRYYCKKGR